jgi:hypothetical protein
MRTVREEISVSTVIDAEGAIYPRLQDAYDALTWWLAHVPESGEILDDINWLFKQNGNKELKIPALVVIYTFDHQFVTIKYILVRIPSIQ